MRTWTVTGKYPVYSEEDGLSITHTDISISSTSGGYAFYTERIAGNHISKSEEELVALATEAYFKSEYADRAMAESVQKIEEMDKALKDFKKFAADAEARTNEIQQQMVAFETERNERFEIMEAKIDVTVAELTALILGIVNTDEEGEGNEPST